MRTAIFRQDKLFFSKCVRISPANMLSGQPEHKVKASPAI